MKKYLRRSLTAVILLAFLGYFLINIEQFKPLVHLNFYLLFVIAFADMLTIVASGIFTKIILRPFGKSIGLVESVRVSLISTVGNFFAPAGAGFAFRAAYLKKKHQLSYQDYVATLYGNYIIVFLVNSFFGLLGLYLLRSHASSEYFTLVLIFGGIFCVSLLLSVVRIPSGLLNYNIKNKYAGKLAKVLFEMLAGWNRIVADKRLMGKLTVLVTMNFALSLLIAEIEIVALHLTIGLPALLLFSVLGSLSLFVSITPANLGVKEAIYLFSSTVIGLAVSQILSIALIDRGVLFLVLVGLWVATSRMKNLEDVPLPGRQKATKSEKV